MIAGTQIPDTEDNRAILKVLEEFETAMRERSTEKLLPLVSTTYFEDMGTPESNDDYGYDKLTQEIIPKSMEVTKEFYLTLHIHEIKVEDDRARADIRYSSRARLSCLPAPSGTRIRSSIAFSSPAKAKPGASSVDCSRLFSGYTQADLLGNPRQPRRGSPLERVIKCW
ncbi:MAG: hypothetical protein R3C68_17915 [Myxococcota bacterium]